jgi:hypothetical protein
LLQFVVRTIPAVAQDGRDDVVLVDTGVISHGVLPTGSGHPAR